MEIIIQKSKRKDKKFDAVVNNKTISFGQAGASDFTKHKNPERKQRYIDRHKNNEQWGKDGISTAGFYSRWVLWNKPTLQASIKDLNNKYNNISFKLN